MLAADINIVVSSAEDIVAASLYSKLRSLTCIINRRGPNIDPCGIPFEILNILENTSSPLLFINFTLWLLLVR